MPVVNRVPELAARKFGGVKQINLKQIEKDTDLTYVTVRSWVKGTVNRIDFSTLEIWCKYFGVKPGDILTLED